MGYFLGASSVDAWFGLAIVGVGGVGWVLLSWFRPLTAYSLLLLSYTTVYTRTTLSALGGAALGGEFQRGPGLTDVLWAGLVLGVALRMLLGRERLPRVTAVPWSIWAIVPFSGMAVLLPVVGVLVGDWPLGYVSPGVRQIQWLSLALLGYLLAVWRGFAPVLRATVGVMVAAGLLHTAYASLQLGQYLGLIGEGWLLLDRWFATLSARSWFYYPRLTGLLVNPNSYGLFGALLVVVGFALFKASRHRTLAFMALLTGAFALVFSGSRSALLGLAASIGVTLAVTLIRRRISRRELRIAGGAVTGGTVVGVLVWPLVPQVLRGRFERFLMVFAVGLEAESNAVARLRFWEQALVQTLADHPLGTWVPPSYALDNPIDSYYVFTALQGTPGYTMLWLLFLLGVIGVGYRLLGRSVLQGRPHGVAAATMLMGFAGVIAGGSLTLSPLLQPQILAPFWMVLGLCIAGCLGRCRGREIAAASG